MENTPVANPPPENLPQMPPQKKRHGCLTTWLILIIIGNALMTIIYAAGASWLGDIGGVPGWAIWISVIMGIFGIVCAIALFMWKKWGFWGFCASSVIGIIVNVATGGGIFSIVSSIVSIALLYGVLNIGKDNKGWSQLE